MATKDKNQPRIQDTQGGGFGKYREDTGGGHVFAAGDSNTRTTKENGKTRQKENPTTKQPRTNDGKFTYKSANGQEIDPKYGPSRGKTVNPVLTGGVNGIEIDEVEKQFAQEKGAYWDKFKDKWYEVGGEIIAKNLKTKVAGQAVWNVAKEYKKDLGEFKGESEVFSSKSGKKSKEEAAATQKAAKSGKYQYVYNKDKAGENKIKSFKKKVVEPSAPMAEPEAPVAPAPAQETPAPAPQPAASAPKAEYVSKYSDEQLGKVSDYFQGKDWPEDKKQAVINKFNSLSPEQKEKQIDSWKSKGVDFGF